MSAGQNPPRRRPLRRAVVERTERLARDLVRVHLRGDDIAAIGPVEHTDSYVKLLFPPAGAGYRAPFDPDEVAATLPPDQWPVTRTYTLRQHDPRAGTMALDFVVHGDTGVAGPWAARVAAGEPVCFRGPGGKWSPRQGSGALVLVGDEAAAPAIAAALEALPPDRAARVFLEVSDAGGHIPLGEPPHAKVQWVHRDGVPHGIALSQAVRAAGPPVPGTRWFVHGNADMVRDLRRYLFVEHQVPRGHVSISGYWRTGQDEDTWQATKHDFVAQMEADEQVPPPAAVG